MKLARKRNQWPLIRLPEKRGKITVSDVVKKPEGKKRDEAIKKWCESVWAAFQEDHQVII